MRGEGRHGTPTNEDAELAHWLTALLVSDLCVKPTEHKVVIADPGTLPHTLRIALYAVLVRELRAPAVCFLRQAVAACLSSACWTGLVVDVGAADTRITPVVHGHPITHAEAGACCRPVRCRLRPVVDRSVDGSCSIGFPHASLPVGCEADVALPVGFLLVCICCVCARAPLV
jgi:hypothetical protein